MQNLSLQVNRPHGWGFHEITDGVVKHMKLWQVSVSTSRYQEVIQFLRHLACSLEF